MVRDYASPDGEGQGGCLGWAVPRSLSLSRLRERVASCVSSEPGEGDFLRTVISLPLTPISFASRAVKLAQTA
jgi:hypothetical protein